jgi:hypothetical protein
MPKSRIYEPRSNDTIDSAARALAELANNHKTSAGMVFNDIRVKAEPGDTAEKITKQWWELECKKKQDAVNAYIGSLYAIPDKDTQAAIEWTIGFSRIDNMDKRRTDITYNKGAIADQLEAITGIKPNVGGDNYPDLKDKEAVGTEIIGQVLASFRRGEPIRGLTVKLVNIYKELHDKELDAAEYKAGESWAESVKEESRGRTKGA